MMPIVNGHQVETGCYVEGSWGQYGPDHLAEIAEAFGMELTPDTDPRAWRAGQFEEDPNVPEYIEFALDVIEQWLNDHTAVQCAVCHGELIWHDDADEPEGYWVHAPEVPSVCPTPIPYQFLWTWEDGEFFLMEMEYDE